MVRGQDVTFSGLSPALGCLVADCRLPTAERASARLKFSRLIDLAPRSRGRYTDLSSVELLRGFGRALWIICAVGLTDQFKAKGVVFRNSGRIVGTVDAHYVPCSGSKTAYCKLAYDLIASFELSLSFYGRSQKTWVATPDPGGWMNETVRDVGSDGTMLHGHSA